MNIESKYSIIEEIKVSLPHLKNPRNFPHYIYILQCEFEGQS